MTAGVKFLLSMVFYDFPCFLKTDSLHLSLLCFQNLRFFFTRTLHILNYHPGRSCTSCLTTLDVVSMFPQALIPSVWRHPIYHSPNTLPLFTLHSHVDTSDQQTSTSLPVSKCHLLVILNKYWTKRCCWFWFPAFPWTKKLLIIVHPWQKNSPMVLQTWKKNGLSKFFCNTMSNLPATGSWYVKKLGFLSNCWSDFNRILILVTQISCV